MGLRRRRSEPRANRNGEGEAIVSPVYKDAAQADVLSVLGLFGELKSSLFCAAKMNFFHTRNDNISSKKVLTLALKYGIIEGWVLAARKY